MAADTSISAPLIEAETEIHRLKRLVQELESLAYVPGGLICDSCGLVALSASSSPGGAVYVNGTIHQCLNGCGKMRRISERERRVAAELQYTDLWDLIHDNSH